MKIIFCTIIVFACGTFGIILNSQQQKEIKFYKDLIAFLHFTKTKIAFFNESLSSIAEQFYTSSNNIFFHNLSLMFSSSIITKQSLEKILPIKDTEDIIYSSLCSLGKSDSTSEISGINLSIDKLNLTLDILVNQKSKKTKLISKLSVCFGLLICILIY